MSLTQVNIRDVTVSSLAFAQGLHWMWTAAVRIGLIYCAAAAAIATVEQAGSSADLFADC
jgi:hypothetical protein